MNNPSDRRHFWRTHFHAAAKLMIGAKAQPCRLEDISLKGALVEVPEGTVVAKGQTCRLMLDLATGTTITMQTTVVHIDGLNIGVRCDSIDLDSITHLRRLVELNTGDPTVLERDIAALLNDQKETR